MSQVKAPNSFRRKEYRQAFAEIVAAYDSKARVLFNPDGSRCMGNSIANAFWRGFDGTMIGGHWDRASKELLSYVYWKAGQTVQRGYQRGALMIEKECPRCEQILPEIAPKQ